MFAFYLSDKNNDSIKSDVTFGYYDKTKFTGDLLWYPVMFKNMFAIQLDDIKVNGKSTGACKVVKECLLIIDSGTSTMSMPKVGMQNFEK
jgi:hypothetical protein